MLDKAVAQAAVDTYLSALVAGDIDAIVALYDAEATVEDPVGSEALQGSDAIRAFYAKAAGAIAEAAPAGAIRCAGMEVAFPFRLVLDLGEKKMAMEIIDVFRFNEAGKVASMRAFWGKENMMPA